MSQHAGTTATFTGLPSCAQSTASLPASAGVSPGMSSTAAELGELPHEAAVVFAAQRAKHEADMVEAKKKFMQGEPDSLSCRSIGLAAPL